MSSYHDTVVKVLVLMVYTNSKTFHVYKFVGGKPIKPKLGNFPDMTVEQARAEATKMLGDISKGEPVVSRRILKPTGALTLAELFDRYIEEYAQHHCTTWAETQKNFRRYFDIWLSAPIDTITRNEVQQHMNFLGRTRGHHTANRSYDDLRAVYSWGTKYGVFFGANPCTNITKFKTRARERFIRPDEFENFLEALRGEKNVPFRDYVYLSLFTGARQTNVLSMRWDQIDFDLGLWHIPITKNKESQTIPLTDLALKVLNDRYDKRKKKTDEWVFPSTCATGHVVEPKTAWRKFMKRTGLQDLRMHDLRRTLGSYMAMNNQSLQIIGKVLGHKSPTATQIYSRLSFDPLKQSMEAAQASMARSVEILPAEMTKKKPNRKLKRVK
ncbi:tyrosine-type recombinase/integrase [Candidatus Obscuribacterales bacterium]|nr:tyrosine-type recombinase/integrase [Candidatus Obscuribacterales bacterium]